MTLNILKCIKKNTNRSLDECAKICPFSQSNNDESPQFKNGVQNQEWPTL